MRQNCQNLLLCFIFLLISAASSAQTDTIPSSENGLQQLINARYPKKYVISGIDVTGNVDIDKNLIINISGISIGDEVMVPGTDVFGKAIEKLWRQNLVSDVQIYYTKVIDNNLYIEINLTQRPRLIDYTFSGIKKAEQDELIPKMNLGKERVVTENMKLSAIEAIRKHYVDKGYRNVEVTLTETPYIGVANAVSYQFDVAKGTKVRVNSINFSDNPSIADLKLKKQMKGTKEMTKITLFPEKVYSPYLDTIKNPSFRQYLQEAAYLRPSLTKEYLDPYVRIKFFANSKFNDKKYEEDKEKVLSYYNAQGFRDARIIEDTLMKTPDGNVNIDMRVSEGRRYYFGNITWKGNTKYSDSVLNLILGIRKGDVYNLEVLNKKIGKEMAPEGGDISSLYQDDGYLFFDINAVETAVYNDTIDHEIVLREGSQATYGNITVSGNEKTKDYVIIREMRTVPGDQYSRSDIIRTVRELGQLGFLNAEKINPQITPHPETGTVDINWQVEEKSADQVELSAGFGGGVGLTGTLGLSFSNFSLKNLLQKKGWDPLPSGDGQKLSLRVQANGAYYRAYNFSFTEPWLGGKKRNSFTVGYFNTKMGRTYDSLGGYCKSCADDQYIKNAGFSVSLGKQLKWPDDFFNLIYSLNIQTYKIKNYPGFFQGITTGKSNNISFKVALIRNSAGPNPIFPTSGSNFALSSQFTLPYYALGINKGTSELDQFKWPEFHKWRFNGEWYIPIGIAKGEDRNKQFVMKLAAKYGFIGKYKSTFEFSPFERFQLGDAGMSNQYGVLGYDIISHRGYPIYNNSDPRVNPENIATDKYFTIFNKYTAEIRYPFSTAASSTIYGLAFFEAANGWYDYKTYNPFRLRRSAGIGMRFFLPMFGLLGFDYGIGFDRYDKSTGLKGAAKFTFMLGQEPE